MAWIRTVPEQDAEGELARLYAAHSDPGSGRVDEILRVHSLAPRGLAAHLGLYAHAMSSSPGLRKVEREMIAVTVSRLNGCRY